MRDTSRPRRECLPGNDESQPEQGGTDQKGEVGGVGVNDEPEYLVPQSRHSEKPGEEAERCAGEVGHKRYPAGAGHHVDEREWRDRNEADGCNRDKPAAADPVANAAEPRSKKALERTAAEPGSNQIRQQGAHKLPTAA